MVNEKENENKIEEIRMSRKEIYATQIAVVDSLKMFEDFLIEDNLDDEHLQQALDLVIIFRKILNILDIHNENLLATYVETKKESLPDNVIDFQEALLEKGIDYDK